MAAPVDYKAVIFAHYGVAVPAGRVANSVQDLIKLMEAKKVSIEDGKFKCPKVR